MKPPLLIKNALICDPSQDIEDIGYILIKDSKVADIKIGSEFDGLPDGCVIEDANGHLLIPGLVDLHVRVGEPGSEHRETLQSASEAAAAGGITTYLMMPATNPVIDNVALVDFVKRTAKAASKVNVCSAAALTIGLDGREMTEIGLLCKAGAKAFYQGPWSLTDNMLLKRILTYASDFQTTVICETQDQNLTSSGVMNSGLNATRMGLSGICEEAEIIPLERDMRLVALTNSRYHAAQLSTATSINVIRDAKKHGLKVTAGVSINNLTLNELDVGAYRTFFKLSPPLRSESNRLAMIEALRDGTLDVIVSSHNPQDTDTKRHPFADSENGAIGLETLLCASLRLFHNQSLPLKTIIQALTINPARILGVNAGSLKIGSPADMVLVDLNAPFIVQPENLKSLSKNTPFENDKFEGLVQKTWLAGNLIFDVNNR